MTTHRRLRFDGQQYFIISDYPSDYSYCGEAGTFQVSAGNAVTFTPGEVAGVGYRPCPQASPRVEVARRTGSGLELDAGGTVGTYVPVRDVPKVFVTFETHDGNLAGDATIPGANPIEKADAICNRSIAKPDGGRYRAMLVDGVNRAALPPKDGCCPLSRPTIRPTAPSTSSRRTRAG